jgi:glutathione S-transferase
VGNTRGRGTLITFPPSVDFETERCVLSHHATPFAEKRNSGPGSALRTLRHRAKISLFQIDGRAFSQPRPIAGYLDAFASNANRRLTPSDPVVAKEIDALWSEINGEMGVWIAHWVCNDVFADRELSFHLTTKGVPGWQRAIEPIFHPLTVFIMKRGLRLHLPETPHRALGQCRRIFDAMSGRLLDDRPFLVGERFTLADIAFCACASPMMLDDPYGGALLTLSDVTPRLREVANELRSAPAGNFVQRLYKGHYRPSWVS